MAYDEQVFANAEQATLVAARAQGCTCNPDITVSANGHAYVRHDDWCALLRQQDIN